MTINLNDLVVALSHALDFLEMDLLGVASNHSKRVAYIACRVGRVLGLPEEALVDLLTLAILHDNGIGVALTDPASLATSGDRYSLEALEAGAGHCLAGQANIKPFPFLTGAIDVLTFHHENWDGSGYFKLQGGDIPLLARIIRLSDLAELRLDLRTVDHAGKAGLLAFLAERSASYFDPHLVEAFREAANHAAFWLDLKDEFVGPALRGIAPKVSVPLTWAELRGVTDIFSRIIDSKSRFTRVHSSELSERAGAMARRYGRGPDEVEKLRIAADLHDIGKLAVSNAILDKPGKLEPPEIDVIQRHTYYTRVSLQAIAGFEDITEWASNHHETLNGQGYPYRKSAPDLDANSRLLACLDIYQALTEVRPYRTALSHQEALAIMGRMAAAGRIDGAIVREVDEAFAP